MSALHVLVGPPAHGVVRFAERLAERLGGPVVRLDGPDGVLPLEVLVPRPDVDVAVLHYTDALYAATTTAAAQAFVALRRRVPLPVAVSLHDLPDPDDEPGRLARRGAAYAAVAGACEAVVVASEHERDRLGRVAPGLGERVVVVPLPVDAVHVPPGDRPPAASEVAVLGFVHPEKGHGDVLDALSGLPADIGLTAVGRAADGHDDLLDHLARTAAAQGRSFTVTGFVPDDALGDRLARAGVPVAPWARVSASGSVSTWLEAGRRPLVADGPYARELDRRCPGAVRRYRPDDLPRLLAAALADPGSTWLGPDVEVGPTAAQAGAAWAWVLDRVAGRRAAGPRPAGVVPGNRWDLAPAASRLPSVSVVVPHYEDQAGLDRLLAALAVQDYPGSRYEVVVADDGSRRPPALPAALRGTQVPVRLVRQADRGFRAGAARNLGARAAHGEVLCFLDGDVVPEPGYLRAATRLPAALPDAVVVGRRRHADLEGWSDAEVTAWLTGGQPAPEVLDEPAWLADAYAGSRDLLDADRRSYRYVISAVLTLGAALFAELGGFEESFDRYGGEDWELAHRAWAAGAVLAHAPDAVAWHDGPDWAGRSSQEQRAQDKQTEQEMLTRLVPDPEERGPAEGQAVRMVLVRPHPQDDGSAAHVASERLRDNGIDATAVDGGVDPDVLRRALVVVDLPPGGLPADVPPGLADGVRDAADVAAERVVVALPGAGAVVCTSLPAARRLDRHVRRVG